jgi:2-octaprenylphenol hydroxylase
VAQILSWQASNNNRHMSLKDHYDIVIHGAGIPGMSLALLLARQSAITPPSILIVDQHHHAPSPDAMARPAGINDFDQRVFALTYASKQLFESIQAWPGDDAARVYPYDKMNVWDSGNGSSITKGKIVFDAAEVGTPCLGYIVENRVIQDWLSGQLQLIGTIDLCDGDSLLRFRNEDSGLRIFFQSGKCLTTKLLVGADGAMSRVRQLAGISLAHWSYQQTAVVATVETEKHHQNTAWQRFLTTGPLAFLPMQPPYCSIVWSTTDAQANMLCAATEQAFCQQLQASFENTLGSIKAVGPRASFPLNMRHATRYTARRVVLIADAAHSVHPLAGQGLNLGLLDVAMLASHVLEAMQAGKDPGASSALRAYERSRKADNWVMQTSFDVLKRLFSNDQRSLGLIRTIGLNAINRATAVKNQFAGKAMGLGG